MGIKGFEDSIRKCKCTFSSSNIFGNDYHIPLSGSSREPFLRQLISLFLTSADPTFGFLNPYLTFETSWGRINDGLSYICMLGGVNERWKVAKLRNEEFVKKGPNTSTCTCVLKNVYVVFVNFSYLSCCGHHLPNYTERRVGRVTRRNFR